MTEEAGSQGPGNTETLRRGMRRATSSNEWQRIGSVESKPRDRRLHEVFQKHLAGAGDSRNALKDAGCPIP